MNRWERSRRQLIKDLGVGLACLPLLAAGRARGASRRKNLVIIASIEGYRTAAWQPPDGPLVAPLPKSSSPLEPHLADVTFLHNLANKATGGCTRCGPNAYGAIYYGLPPAAGSGGYVEPKGPTVDQVIAQALNPLVPFRSLNFGVQVGLTPSTGGPGHDHCFWSGPGQPLAVELDPVSAYARLFGLGPGVTSAQTLEARRLLVERKSILDFVSGRLAGFQARLGTEDRQLIDGHLDAIRQLEQQLSASPLLSGDCGGNPGPAVDFTDGQKYADILSAFLKIIPAALACGRTQVATLQLSDATGVSIDFSFVPGIPPRGTGYKTASRNWSDLGHNPVLGGVDHKQIVDQWWMMRLAAFIAQMKAIPDPSGGTLFDNTVVLWGNNLHEGADLDANRLPWILAGRCGGYFKGGQCLGGNNTTMVLADLCNAMGVTTHPYGAGFPGLKA